MKRIDIAPYLGIAQTAILRTSVFLGLGVNAARNPDFNNYSLNRDSAIHIAPDNVDASTLASYKQEFERWVVASGFRELIETFAVFVDSIHDLCSAMAVYTGRQSPDKSAAVARRFRSKGIKEKLDILRKDYGFTVDTSECLCTINQARNCMAHRRGIVGPKDCFSRDAIEVRWYRIEFYCDEPDGKVRVLETPVREPVLLPEGASLKLRYVQVSREFALGTIIQFEPRELQEICSFASLLVGGFRDALIQYAVRIGVPVDQPPQPVSAPGFSAGPPQESSDGTKNVKFQFRPGRE
jgi:hypothetical protein